MRAVSFHCQASDDVARARTETAAGTGPQEGRARSGRRLALMLSRYGFRSPVGTGRWVPHHSVDGARRGCACAEENAPARFAQRVRRPLAERTALAASPIRRLRKKRLRWRRTPPPHIRGVYSVYSVPRSCSRQRMMTQASSIHAESINDFRPFRVKVLTSRPPRTTSVAFRPKMVCTGTNGTLPRTAAGTGSVHKRAWRPLHGGIPCRRSEARRSRPIRYAEWS